MENAVHLEDVTFFYPRREIEVVENTITAVENPDEINQVFTGTTVDLPAGVLSLVGQNGIGKSTLLLLAGARLFPHRGSVTILGTDTNVFRNAETDPDVEEQRNRLVSFVYQNMEFETTESIGDLMELVFENGFFTDRPSELVATIRTELEMSAFLHLRTQQLAKGQLQRAIIAFSLLYGSTIIMMDEPVFALEESQKDRAFELLIHYAADYKVPIYYSAHNLELTEKYSDYVLLFSTTGDFQIGPTEELFTRENIELAYQAPMDTLHRRDLLYREMLVKETEGRK